MNFVPLAAVIAIHDRAERVEGVQIMMALAASGIAEADFARWLARGAKRIKV
ncbi:MAG: hypothetical protein AB3N11_06645 [Arenibacterium sp.]